MASNALVATVLSIAVFIATMMLLGSRHSEQQPHDKTCQAKTQSKTSNSQNNLTLSKAGDSNRSSDNSEDHHSIRSIIAKRINRFGHWFWFRALSNDGLLVLFNGILAVATFVLVIYNGALWEETARQAKASYRAAQAAEDANRIARDSLEISNRANINIEDVKFEDFQIGGSFKFSYVLHNTGRVTASGIQEASPVMYGPTPSPGMRGTATGFMPPSNDPFAATMGPGETWPRNGELGRIPKDAPPEAIKMMLTREKIEEAIRGKLALQVMFVVSYYDGFGKPRSTYRLYTWDTFDGGGFRLQQSQQQ
jgi:hypothetical protein